MSKLYFKIGADYDKVIRLRDEISKLRTELIGMNRAANPREFIRLEKQLRQTTQEFNRLTSQAAIAAAQMGNTNINIRTTTRGLNAMDSSLAKIGGVAALTKLVSDVIRVRGEFQQLDVAFTTLLQSKEKANALMAQMVETAAKTPFNLTELATGARQLVAYGFASEEVNGTLVRLGNVASGLGLPLERLTYLYGTTMTQGRLYARDLMQFTTSGIPMLQGLADIYGVSTAKVNEMVTAGKIGFPEVQKVIENMTNEGGKFFNLMEEQSKTITGKISNLGDAMDTMFNSIGQANEGVINDSIDGLKYLVENYEQVGRILIGLVATYGVYKAATITYYAITKTYGIYDIATKELQLAATMRNIVATKAMTIQQALLNKTMLANPYVLIATLVVGAAAAMWALRDSTTAAEKANVRYNKTIEEQNQKEEERKNNIEELISTIQDNNKAEGERLTALEALKKEYSNIFDKYLTETEFLKEILKYKRLIAEEDGRRTNITDQEQLRLEQLKLYEYENNKKKGIIRADLDGNGWGETNVDDAIKAQLEIVNKAKAKVAEYSVSSYLPGIKELKDGEITSTIDDINKSLKSIGKSGDDAIAVVSSLGGEFSKKQLLSIKSGLETEENVRSGERKSGSDWLSDAKNEYQKALKDLKDFESSKTKLAKEEYNRMHKELKDNVDAEEKKYKNLGGVTGSSLTKQENQSEKLRKDQEKYKLLMDKQKLDQVRSEEDLQMQVDDARIKTMDEGSKKTIAQMELNFEKEMQTIDRQKEDALRKKIEDARKEFEDNPENKNKSFDATGIELSDDEKKKYDALYKSEIESFEQDKQRMEFQHMQDYLKEYGTFQQKKLAIAKEYDEKIRNSQDEWEKKSFAKERDTKISGLETDAIKANIDWVTVFGEFGGMFNDMIKPALEKAKEYIKTDKFKNSDQDSQKSLIDAINQMEKSLGGAGGLNFKKLGEDVKAYHLAEQNRILAIESEEDAINKLKKAQEDYEKAIKSGTETEKLVAKDTLDNAQQNADAASANVKAQTDISNQSQQDVTDTATKLKANMDNVTEGLSKLASGGIKNAYDGLIQAGKGMGGAIEAVSDKLEDVPIIGWIVSIIDVFKDGLSDLVGGLLDSIFNAVSGIISDVLSGDIFVTIGKSLRDGIGNIFNAISFGGWNSLMDSISGSNASDTADTISRLTTSNEALKVSIDGLKEEIKGSNGTKSIEAYNEAADAQKRYEENLRQILDAQMGYHSAHHSNSYYWDLKDSSLSQINSLLGTNLSDSWSDFSKLTADQMNEIRTHLPDIWTEMIDEGEYGDRFKEDWNNYADQAGKVKEMTDELRENLAQISFDSLRDSFVDALMDMDTKAEDFAKHFEEYMTKALLNFAVGNKMDKNLEKWYNSWTDTMNAQNGKLTEKQIEDYRSQWENFVQEGIKTRDEIAELTGYTGNASSSSQDSTQKGFAAMSQDTGDELNGRFTALQIAGEEIKNQNILQSQSLNILAVKADAILTVNTETRNIADEIRTIQVNSYLELQEIRENTGMSAKSLKAMESKLDKIESNTKALSSK